MEELMTLFNQCNNLCFWLNKYTKLDVTYIFDGQDKSYHVEVRNNNNEILYAHHIEGIFVKAEKVIIFDIQQLINYLIELKRDKQVEIV